MDSGMDSTISQQEDEMISDTETMARTRTSDAPLAASAKPSVAQLMGHAIHPLLVAFPITFYTIATASFITYAVNANVFWFRVAFYSAFAGVIAAVVAAIPGMADYFGSIPARDPAKKVGRNHIAFNTLALFFYASIVVMMWTSVTPEAIYTESVTAPMWLSIAGLASTLAAGYFGGELVQKHHVGIEPGVARTAIPRTRTTTAYSST